MVNENISDQSSFGNRQNNIGGVVLFIKKTSNTQSLIFQLLEKLCQFA